MPQAIDDEALLDAIRDCFVELGGDLAKVDLLEEFIGRVCSSIDAVRPLVHPATKLPDLRLALDSILNATEPSKRRPSSDQNLRRQVLALPIDTREKLYADMNLVHRARAGHTRKAVSTRSVPDSWTDEQIRVCNIDVLAEALRGVLLQGQYVEKPRVRGGSQKPHIRDVVLQPGGRPRGGRPIESGKQLLASFLSVDIEVVFPGFQPNRWREDDPRSPFYRLAAACFNHLRLNGSAWAVRMYLKSLKNTK